MPPGLAWGEWREGIVWFSVCGAPLGDWANGGCVDVLVTSVVSLRMVSMVLVFWGDGFILGNGYGRTKLCCIATGKRNAGLRSRNLITGR